MNLSFITSFFKQKKETSKPLEMVLIKKLKQTAIENNLLIFENSTIYHHKKNFLIPIIIIDEHRGIFIFEYKDWSYDDLKNATIQKSSQQNSSSNTLAFDKAHKAIRDRFKEIVHNDGVPIFNFLLMEHLDTTQYNFLSPSIKEHLPAKNIIFNNIEPDDIFSKIESVISISKKLPSKEEIVTTLYSQYTIFDKSEIKLATDEQIKFIDLKIEPRQTLSGGFRSGKSSAIISKIILEKLRNPNIKICVIKPNKLSCDIFKKQLLNTIEYSIVEVDITPIKIFTPLELINYHLNKLNKNSTDELFIDKLLMSKKLSIADYLICDDANLIDSKFAQYLEHIQKNSNLLLVHNISTSEENFELTKILKPKKTKIDFYQSHQHAKALQLISTLLKDNKANDILIISNKLSKEKLKDDLEYFIEDETTLIDSSKKIIEQNLNNLLLSTYEDMLSLDAKHILLMDVCTISLDKINYAYHIAQESISILYEEECEKIFEIKDNFEITKE